MKTTEYSKQNARFFDGKATKISPIFNLRVSEEEKYKNDGEWFKNYMEFIVPPLNHSVQNYEEKKTCYDLVNGDLKAFNEKIKAFCNPLGIPEMEVDETLEPYPKIYTKLNVLKGEFLKRGDNHKAVLLTAKAIKDKNKKMVQSIMNSAEQELALALMEMQEIMETMDPQQQQQYIEELRAENTPEDIVARDYLSDWEVFANKIIKYAHYDQNLMSKKMDTLEDCMIADEAFVYCGFLHGRPMVEVRNTLFTGYRKAPNEFRIHKGDFVWYKKAITIADVYNNYGSVLSDDEIEELGIYSYTNNHRIDERHDVLGGTARSVFDHNQQHLLNDVFMSDPYNSKTDIEGDKQVGTAMKQGRANGYSNDALVWETHFEFKAYKRLMFLTYKDEYGESVTTILSDKAESMIPPDATKEKRVNRYGDTNEFVVWVDPVSNTQYEVEFLYIPRKYEIIRLGDNIYPIYREVPYQTTNLESPYSSFELSTKGIILNARNSKSVSMVQRAIPAYFEYLFVKHVQKRELSKYQGYIQSIDADQIPNELGEDVDGNPIRDKVSAYLAFLKKSNIDLYSGTGSSEGSYVPSTRSPGSSGYMLGVASELLNLQMLVEYLDREIGMSMGISPQREAQFSNNSNVTDNQQAITQSHHITEPLFFLHNMLWTDVLQEYIKNFRTYCTNYFQSNPDEKNMILHFIAPNGARELLEVTPDLLSMSDIGLWTSNTTQDQQYQQYMLSQIQAFAQNAGEGVETVSTILKGITAQESPETIHKMIQVLNKQQQDRLAEMQKQEQQARLEELASERETRALELQDQRDMIELQEALRLERELKVTEARALHDANRNNIPDVVEKYRVDVEKVIAEKKLALEEREIRRKELADRANKTLKEKEIAAKKAGKK